MYENEAQRLARLFQDVASKSAEMKRLEPAFTEAQMILSQPPEIREIILRARGDSFEQWMEKRAIKAELKQLKTSFLLPENQELFSREDARFWVSKNGLGKKKRNLNKHIRKWRKDLKLQEGEEASRDEFVMFLHRLKENEPEEKT